MENTEKTELNAESVSTSLSKKLVDNSIVNPNDVSVLDQKVIIRNLLNYTGNYFLNPNNECKVRCFDKTPNLVAIICEYTLDTKISDVKAVEKRLKACLTNLGFVIIST